MFYLVFHFPILGRPKLADVIEAQFRRGSRSVHVKTDYTASECKEFDFLLKKVTALFKETYFGFKLVEFLVTKKDIITKLCPLMPETRRSFWYNLETNEQSTDLIDTFE